MDFLSTSDRLFLFQLFFVDSSTSAWSLFWTGLWRLRTSALDTFFCSVSSTLDFGLGFFFFFFFFLFFFFLFFLFVFCLLFWFFSFFFVLFFDFGILALDFFFIVSFSFCRSLL